MTGHSSAGNRAEYRGREGGMPRAGNPSERSTSLCSAFGVILRVFSDVCLGWAAEIRFGVESLK